MNSSGELWASDLEGKLSHCRQTQHLVRWGSDSIVVVVGMRSSPHQVNVQEYSEKNGKLHLVFFWSQFFFFNLKHNFDVFVPDKKTNFRKTQLLVIIDKNYEHKMC